MGSERFATITVASFVIYARENGRRHFISAPEIFRERSAGSRGFLQARRNDAPWKFIISPVGRTWNFEGERPRRIPQGILRESNLHKTINKTRLISVGGDWARVARSRKFQGSYAVPPSRRRTIDLSRGVIAICYRHSSKRKYFFDIFLTCEHTSGKCPREI